MSQKRPKLFEFLIPLIALALTWVALEGVFYAWVTPSDGFAITLAGRRWFQKHWKPLNSLHYRDREHPAAHLVGKKIVFVAGDSFVAGHGIDNAQDRFPDQLQALLGNSWEVINIAQCGWGTINEMQAIAEYPARPDVIILSYFVNDIDITATLAGCELPAYKAQLPLPLRKSYLLNFLYWRMYRHTQKNLADTYWRFIADSYADKRILNAHLAALQKVIDYAYEKNSRLVVLLFPHLPDIETTRRMMNPIVTYLDQQHIEVVDLAPTVLNRPTSDLVVNPYDAHPSMQLHREVATLLFKTIKKAP